MSIKDKYEVRQIQKEETYPWILKKHYAKRKPPISFSFGLYKENILEGICTFGPPAKLMNSGFCIFDGQLSIPTYELNRLVISERLGKNVLSFFVGNLLRLIKESCCIVSYSDIDQGHHGYIYQATNWIYTGETEQTGGYTYFFDNDWQHPRTTVSRFGSREHSKIIQMFPDIEFKKVSKKYRYFKFIGTKKEVKKMNKLLKYDILPYPKGDNKRYDANYTPDVQGLLF